MSTGGLRLTDAPASPARGMWLDQRPTEDQFRQPRSMLFLAPMAAVLLIVGLAYALDRTDYDFWGAFVIGPALILLTVPLATRAGRTDDDPTLPRVVVLAAVVKLTLGVTARYFVNFSVYGGSADSVQYYNEGRRLAPFFRQGIFENLGEISGTRSIEIFTGLVFGITGTSEVGGFMVFSWLSFLGCFLFYRAFRLAYPGGDHRRYLYFVLFFPSLLFWPASIGKDAIMVCLLGCAAYGVAALLNGRAKGLLWMAGGLWGMTVIRPHLALAILAGVVVALPMRNRTWASDRPGRPGVLSGRGAKLVLVVGMALAAIFVIGQTQEFFNLTSLSAESAGAVLENTGERTAQGGSEFTTQSPASLLGLGNALVTVIFRPFPFEVGNVQGLISGGEGLVLVALAIWSLPRLARLPVEAVRHPYIAFAAGYVFAFCFAFSAINNFGILARQRSQLLPVLFVLFCIQPLSQASAVTDARGPAEAGLRRAR